eukprot:Hpha_TRINITY_DN15957_c1_g1::TRINITY_DN15957_c1_g1_i2::g.73199::m.73199
MPPQNTVNLYDLALIDSKLTNATSRTPRVLTMSEIQAALPIGTELEGNLTGLPHLHLRVEGVLATRPSVLAGKPAGTHSYYVPLTALKHEFDTKPGETKAVYQYLMAEALGVHVYQISDIVFTHGTGVLGRRGHALAALAGKIDQHLCPTICSGPSGVSDDDDASMLVGITFIVLLFVGGLAIVAWKGAQKKEEEPEKKVEAPYGDDDEEMRENTGYRTDGSQADPPLQEKPAAPYGDEAAHEDPEV